MKKKKKFEVCYSYAFKKTFRIMRIAVFFLLIGILQSYANNVYSQKARLSLSRENTRLVYILNEIEGNSEFFFLYNEKLVDTERKVSISVKDKKIEEILDLLFSGTDIKYSIVDRKIVLAPDFIKPATQQEHTVSGKVTDNGGLPLPGVSVVVKGTTQGTVTNADGEYSLSNIPANASLQFSFVGMKSQEIVVGSQTSINVVLEEETIGIEEVVAVGYGTQKKRDIIGSIASVKSDVLDPSSSTSNFSTLLQGQAAGVSVQTSSGRLGAGAQINVRGLSSISAGTGPLWIIDGVPIITSASTTDDRYTSGLSTMALINQVDIESIEVLKDAAATAIYGSRGSNGVILVTTKTGEMGKMSVNVDYSTGVSDLPFHKVEFVNTQQWFEYRNKQKQSYGLGDYTMEDFYAGQVYAFEKLTLEQAKATNTDWFDETMRKGNFQSINFSTVGGAKAARFFVSANYRMDKGVMLNDDLERFGLRANVDLEPVKNFRTGIRMNMSLTNSSRGTNFYTDANGNNTGMAGGFSYVNNRGYSFLPVYSLENPNEYLNPYQGNPAALIDPDYMLQDINMYRILSGIYGEYSFPFLEGLSLRTELSMDFVQSNRNTWTSKEIRNNGSFADDAARTSKSFNYNAFLTYNKVIGDHVFDIVAGVEAQRSTSWLRAMQGQKLVGSYQELGTPSEFLYMFSGLSNENYLLSNFGRANYKFKDKYLAGVSFRRDGSSVFTPDYRWGNFLAFSAGWILSDEQFMDSFGNKHFLKIRGSFGQTGNQSIPSNLDASKYTSGLPYGGMDIFATNGTRVATIGVANLTWETTNNLDFGVDFGFFSNRINGSLAYYNKYVEDLLLASDLPLSSGISSIYGNIGDLVNSGVELNISSVNLESKNLKWQTSFNISYNHNEVKKLTPLVDEAGTGMVSTPYISKVGYSVRDYYMADWSGIDSQTGLPMIYALDKNHYNETGETRRLKDESGNDILLIDNSANANANRFHLKGRNQIPAYYGGITNTFTYRAFDLGFLVTISGGNYIYDKFMRDAVGAYDGQILKDVYENYWKQPGDNAKYTRANWKGNVTMDDGSVIGLGDPRHDTDQFLFKGDYIKLKSVTLGYTLRESSETKRLFDYLRLYVTVENLHAFTKYPGWDPEGQGVITQWDLPQLLSATFGLSVKF